jgi:hypothetical protein
MRNFPRYDDIPWGRGAARSRRQWQIIREEQMLAELEYELELAYQLELEYERELRYQREAMLREQLWLEEQAYLRRPNRGAAIRRMPQVPSRRWRKSA